MFFKRASRYGDRAALMYKSQDIWHQISWNEFSQFVRNTGLGLMSLGVEPGERVAVLSENRPEWAYADLAILSIGAADAPIYQTNTPEQCAYVVADSGARFVIASTIDQLGKLWSKKDGLAKGLEKIILMDGPAPKEAGDAVMLFSDLIDLGKRHEKPDEFDKRRDLYLRNDWKP
jgi:long-chain acyl-CoA synthetase